MIENLPDPPGKPTGKGPPPLPALKRRPAQRSRTQPIWDAIRAGREEFMRERLADLVEMIRAINANLEGMEPMKQGMIILTIEQSMAGLTAIAKTLGIPAPESADSSNTLEDEIL